MNEKDLKYSISIRKYEVPKCRCGFRLGTELGDGYIEIFENIYEEIAEERIKNKIKHNYIKRCPNCGQLLDFIHEEV